MTVLETIRRGSEFLTRKGVDSPRLQIELLLEHVLQLPRLKLYLSFDRQVTDSETEVLRQLIRRRGEREPLQHLIGSACFCGVEIRVNSHVLIPRPETELLAERAWKHALQTSTDSIPILDFGTGSGCLAILIALKCPQARLHAVDISKEALAVARENADRQHLGGRIQFHAGDGFGALPEGLKFGLIVSNPPYIPAAEIPTLQPEVRDHDPHLALDGGADGLDYYRRLAVESEAWLLDPGMLMMEIGDGQGTAVRGLFEAQGWKVGPVERDYSDRERMVIAHRND